MTTTGGNDPTKSDVPLTFCEALAQFRLRAGLSKRALSQKAGLSTSYVGKLESGELEPSVRAFAVIALALGLTSHEILFCVRCALAERRTRPDAGEFFVSDPKVLQHDTGTTPGLGS